MNSALKNVSEPYDHTETGSADAPPAAHNAQSVTKQPIWEIVIEIGAQIPDAEWVKVPHDASINYKHYLYGTPKKSS